MISLRKQKKNFMAEEIFPADSFFFFCYCSFTYRRNHNSKRIRRFYPSLPPPLSFFSQHEKIFRIEKGKPETAWKVNENQTENDFTALKALKTIAIRYPDYLKPPHNISKSI